MNQATNNSFILPNDSYREFKKEEIEQSISGRFESLVRLYPDRIAVSTQRDQYSYDYLNRSANRIARAILSHCRTKDFPVALLLDQGAPQIISTLGALKAGKFYVPLNPSNPSSRNKHMLYDSGARLIVTNNNNLFIADTLSGQEHQVLNIDRMANDITDEDLTISISPNDLAYILYTSGSTGNPKGIVQNHRNVLHNVMRHTNAYFICPEDRQTLLYTSSVYGGQRDMFNALLNGASLHVYVVKKEGIESLADWLIRNGITIYCSVTTVFRQFTNALTGSEQLDDIRLIKLGGEATYKREMDSYKKYFSSACIMHCGLGSTETGLARNYFINKSTSIGGNTVPLGYPVDGLDILLLDEAGNPLTTEAIGEIAIKSRYISLGYWHNPELTQKAFIPDPDDNESRIYRTGDLGYIHPDGCLEHRGRKDFQIKIRGNRIEAAEIEMALLRITTIKEAVIIGLKDDQGIDRLAAYIVASGEEKPSPNDLWKSLADTLPEFMIPSFFVWLASLPLLPNGKVDRHALPKPETADHNQTHIAPATELEKKIAAIWHEVLGSEQISTQANFFAIGGHSLLAARVMVRINRSCNTRLPLSSLFENQTIAGLAQAVVLTKAQRLADVNLTSMLDHIEALPEAEAEQLLAKKTVEKRS
jgi:amino acid adenylation domain-containing protein